MSGKPYLHWKYTQDLDKAGALLHKGEVIVGSSDTVLGLFAAVSQKGYQQLNCIKQRTDKPYLMLLDSAAALTKYVQMPLQDWVNTLIKQYWPGPLTLIIKARKKLPSWMQANDGTIAVRVPDHKGIRLLAARVGPLFSTSANLSGESVPSRMQDVSPIIMQVVTACIDDEQPPLSKPSTIVDCTGEFPIIIREGAISLAEIMATDVM